MIQDLFSYGATAVAAIMAVYLGTRQARQGDQQGLAARLTQVEGNYASLDGKYTKLLDELQMWRRRELWRERREGILIDGYHDEGLEVPPLPEAPERWV